MTISGAACLLIIQSNMQQAAFVILMLFVLLVLLAKATPAAVPKSEVQLVSIANHAMQHEASGRTQTTQ